jgi:hypothetical protein
MAELPVANSSVSVEKSVLEDLVSAVSGLKEQVARQQEVQVSLTQQLAVLQQQRTSSSTDANPAPSRPSGRLSYLWSVVCYLLPLFLAVWSYYIS